VAKLEVLIAGGGVAALEAALALRHLLPRLTGRPIEGIPHDANGFVATDSSGFVIGVSDVLAAGDMTMFPVKQGGLADRAGAILAPPAGEAIDVEVDLTERGGAPASAR
jgi:sulfide:quinone oxidoreductase